MMDEKKNYYSINKQKYINSQKSDRTSLRHQLLIKTKIFEIIENVSISR